MTPGGRPRAAAAMGSDHLDEDRGEDLGEDLEEDEDEDAEVAD